MNTNRIKFATQALIVELLDYDRLLASDADRRAATQKLIENLRKTSRDMNSLDSGLSRLMERTAGQVRNSSDVTTLHAVIARIGRDLREWLVQRRDAS